ncbi:MULTISPECIES: hypothetical protein [Lactobacillus]|uniref:GyrI-like small molecule binding domain-containing protein n=1 Tax=Lactobacillus panisapium TaxID=2012495 RepID=A0ABX8W8A7_9LACO|nr:MULTISPECIES: hypothetical protein [Lactobacillus]MCO6531310.1 hypothetical protein [Lactobacillus sp.]MCO6533078.1 hypothetical protein [Lactobacillus sp.]MCT6820914.1 hypothetical protein [Lactobacillus panisapium]MCT6853102.1 hypothetical protein [Lactobacillus panisapium]QYN52520.1 hypothetical protein GYM71_03500 [Lactobacillus panisapium]
MQKLQEEITFVGRPFSDQMIDEQKTYNNCNIELEQDQQFQQFLTDNELTNRSSMVVFGPENFMYWYGVLTSEVTELPQGLMKFTLPKAQVAVEEREQQNQSFFAQPLNMVIPQFLQTVREQGIQTYENPGDSLTPYFVQKLDLETKKLTQMLYLEVSQ